MSIFQRLASSFHKKSRISSVSVYRRGGCFFVVTQHGSDGGEPCIVAGPLEQLSLNVAHEELGAAIFRGLSRTTHNYPYPASQQEWKHVSAPLLSAAKCKSWSAFAKTASDLRVDQVEGRVTVHPSMRGAKNGFYPVAERKQELLSPTAVQLGGLVASELEFAAKRDDA
jgi:hypothetical protein